MGSLQEIDHVPFVRPLTKLAATPESTAEIPAWWMRRSRRGRAALRADVRGLPDGLRLHGGSRARGRAARGWGRAPSKGADGAQIERAAELLRGAERPVIMAGTDLYWGHGEQALLELAETLRIPVFLNGLGARLCAGGPRAVLLSRALGRR